MSRTEPRRRRRASHRPTKIHVAESSEKHALADAEERIHRLRHHISEQHTLLVQQQDALLDERQRHAKTGIGVEVLCHQIKSLEAELDAIATEQTMQKRHTAVLEHTLAVKLHGAAPSQAPPIRVEARLRRSKREVRPPPAPFEPPSVDWLALALQYGRPDS